MYQYVKEGNIKDFQHNGFGAHYDLFAEEEMNTLIGNVVMENRWDKPEGIGELSILDNRTVLHASYYRHTYELGYRIGVKYLA